MKCIDISIIALDIFKDKMVEVTGHGASRGRLSIIFISSSRKKDEETERYRYKYTKRWSSTLTRWNYAGIREIRPAAR